MRTEEKSKRVKRLVDSIVRSYLLYKLQGKLSYEYITFDNDTAREIYDTLVSRGYSVRMENRGQNAIHIFVIKGKL